MEIDIVERGCGWPVEDAMYWAIPTSIFGVPMEYYLCDPLRRIPSGIAIRDRGLTMIEVGGVWHIIDHVGSSNYPNAWDWFFEAKRHGFHQKIDVNLDYSKLDRARSWYWMTHDRVIPLNPEAWKIFVEFVQAEDLVNSSCFKGIPDHDLFWQSAGTDILPEDAGNAPLCASLLLTDLIKGEVVSHTDERRVHKVKRTIKSGKEYYGYSLDLDEGKVEWGPGIFAGFPLSIMESVMYPGSDPDKTAEVKERIADAGWDDEIQDVQLRAK